MYKGKEDVKHLDNSKTYLGARSDGTERDGVLGPS